MTSVDLWKTAWQNETKDLDLTNAKAVEKHNKMCAIEWEVLRFTVAKRLGISATVMKASPRPSFFTSSSNVRAAEADVKLPILYIYRLLICLFSTGHVLIKLNFAATSAGTCLLYAPT